MLRELKILGPNASCRQNVQKILNSIYSHYKGMSVVIALKFILVALKIGSLKGLKFQDNDSTIYSQLFILFSIVYYIEPMQPKCLHGFDK